MGENTNFPNALTVPIIIPANSQVDFPIIGNTVRCLESTAAFKVSFDNSSSGIELSAGLAYTCPSDTTFSRVTLKNETGSVNTVKVFIGFGRMDDSRLSVVGASVDVQNKSGTSLRVKDVYQYQNQQRTTVTTAAQNIGLASSSGLLVQNVGADVLKYALFGTVTVSNGFELYPGQTTEIKHVNQVSVICPTTTDIIWSYRSSPTWI